ncbi:hypothetical protein [Aeromicrobium sp. IC_218]|uniref:ApeA N-terminal domain 1-containing protein n=1 Tax=Aeromicrobium sp. IC_218 TaxID=2545468 RepID=UPI00103ED1DF|nr:hypothetical protein [Aeromicrobium sp. IC_218]TCI97399.1 hypothetical protein E0W78_12570 [Aeromicrobium sp. IC_218]
MTRKSALKLSFAPDDYLATWQLPTAKGGTFAAHGALTVEAGKPPKGTAHGDFDDALEQYAPGVTGFPQHVDAPILTGILSNGANVLLINARVTYWISSQAMINAEAAIITLADVSSDKVLFEQVEVQIGGLDAIAGVSPIKSTKFPKKGVAGTWAAELDPKDFRQEWKDADATVGLTYFGSFRSFDPYSFGMGFSPVAWCKLGQPLPLRQILDYWIQPLRRVVSIATGRAEEITYLTVYPATEDDFERKGQVFGSGITQEPYESLRDEIDKIKSPLRLKLDSVSLLELLRTWQKLASVHHPLLETYGSMLHARDQHPRSWFLLLLQAIEGTHGHETKASFANRQKKHTEDRDEVIALAKGSLDTKQQKFLERNIGKRPPGGLEPAINWLANKLPGDVKAELDGTQLIAAMKGAPINAKNAPDALRIMRNDLAHGTKGYDAYELHQVVEVLERMVRAHALELLGCPNDVVSRVLGAS